MSISINAKPLNYGFVMKHMLVLVALLSTKFIITRIPNVSDGTLLAAFGSSPVSGHQDCLSHGPQWINGSFELQ